MISGTEEEGIRKAATTNLVDSMMNTPFVLVAGNVSRTAKKIFFYAMK